jgi:PilZ domain
MVWVITIATFLGTVAVLLMFVIFSQRKQIREALRERRIERRIPAKGDLELSSLDEPPICDQALIENASRHGARVVAKKPWRPNDQLLVTLPECNSPSRARIAYCSSLPGDAFAIGLQFPSVVGDSVKSSNIDPFSHPYRK